MLFLRQASNILRKNSSKHWTQLNPKTDNGLALHTVVHMPEILAYVKSADKLDTES